MSGIGLMAAQGCLQRRLPAGDPAWLRAAAGRSATLAGELRRVARQLTGCLDSTSWSGPAQREFARAMSRRVPELGVVAGRYEQYASALISYAIELDRLQPQLIALRRQLADGVAPAGPVAAGITGQDDARLRQLAWQFEQAWQQWRAALGRCARTLDQAAAIERDRHGWSTVAHRVVAAMELVVPAAHLIEDHSLAGLSGVLGNLGTECVVLGVAMLVVCPPVAAACFTAAAVASAAQLVTDSARAARHDSRVGAGGLGLDALGALPGGRLARTGEQGVRAARTLERLVPAEGLSRLVPGGGLAAHEAAGGHTLARHVAKTPEYLAQRFTETPKPRLASSFYTRAHAEGAIAQLLEGSAAEVRAWLARSAPYLVVSGRASAPVGVSLREGARHARDVAGVLAVLRRDGSMIEGYRIHTAYPQP